MKKLRKGAVLFLLTVTAALCAALLAACGNTVTLNFETGGGSAVKSVEAESGTTFELPSSRRENYALEGWCLEADCSGTVYTGTVTVPDKDTTYYAKWTAGYAVTFDANGGSFLTGAPETLYLAAGANVLDAVKDIVPTRGGVSFGAWFAGDTEVTATYKMPAEAIVLKARYMAEYRIESYLQNLSRNSYVRQETEVTGRGYLGEEVSPEAPSVTGFRRNDAPAGGSPTTSLILTDDPSANVFRFYYDRNEYAVTFFGNLPEGEVSGETPARRAYYEGTVRAPENGFSAPNYRFAGWGTAAAGDVVYQAGSEIPVTGNLNLYAVWDRGLTDRYGSRDLVFFPRLAQDTAVLRRGGQEFEGTRTGDEFVFSKKGGAELKGKRYGLTFSFARTDLAGKYVFFQVEGNENFPLDVSYDAECTIEIDDYMHAVYTNHGARQEGEIVFDEERGDYIFEGPSPMHFMPAAGDQFEYGKVFSVGGEEEGAYIDFVMTDPVEGMGYPLGSMLLVLDGYSTAALLDAVNTISYEGRYYREDVVIKNQAVLYKIVCLFTDTYGVLTGTVGATARNILYTVPLSGEYDGYVSADETLGSYTGDGTLVLDGFGIFSESAVYTKDGVTVRGEYRVSESLLRGTEIAIVDERENVLARFGVDTEKRTFRVYDDAVQYTELRRMDGSSLKPPFLILYNETAEGAGQRTEVRVPDETGETLIVAASGTCTRTPIGTDGRYFRYEFVRTGVENGYETEIPLRMTFYVSSVTSSEDLKIYTVYSVLEETLTSADGSPVTENYAETYAVTGGGTLLRCNSVTAGGLGMLYITASGTVHEGEFTAETTEYFGAYRGTFSYATPEGEIVSLRFDLAESGGSMTATPTQAEERLVYVVPPTGLDENVVGEEVIFTDGAGRLKYSDDGGESTVEGTYRQVDVTVFGDPVYAFTAGGTERFRFVLYTLADYGDQLFASLQDDGMHELYTSSDGTFVPDGFYRATYTEGTADYSGIYARDEFGTTVRFTAENGREFVLLLSGDTFERTDWAIGRDWTLRDVNFELIENNTLSFNGRGTATVRNEGGDLVSSGTYVPLGTYSELWGYEIYLLRGTALGERFPDTATYYVTFAFNANGEGACIVQDAATAGVYVDDEWNVLTLDGYGQGSYVKDGFGGDGSYEIIDFEKGFLAFTVSDPYSAVDGQTFYFLLTGGSFYLTDYAAYAGTFFSPILESAVLGADGVAYLGASSGPYYVLGQTAYLYLDEGTVSLDLSDRTAFTHQGTRYARWADGALTMQGKIFMLEADGSASEEHPALTAEMTFTPSGSNSSRPATFRFAGEEEARTGFSLTLYQSTGDPLMGSTVRVFSPAIVYENMRYSVSFVLADGKYTFEVKAGHTEVEYLDHNARYYIEDVEVPRGGRLVKTTFGFGPFLYDDAVLSGDFLYRYDAGSPVYNKPIHFDGVPESEVRVVGHSRDYGDRLELCFTGDDGVRYALDYFEYYQGGVYFWCYGFYTYEEIESGEFTVGVKRLVYTKMSTAVGYADAQNGTGSAIGKIVAVTLFKDGELIQVYDTGVTPEGYDKAIWLADSASIVENGDRGTCTWGVGYLVTFSEADGGLRAEVTKYDYVQIVLYTECFVNLFVDENGETLLAAFALYNEDWGRYDWLSNYREAEKTETGFRFKADLDGKTYVFEIEVTKGEDVEFEADGEHYQKPTYAVTVSQT